MLFGANRAAKTSTIIGAEGTWWALGNHPYRGKVEGEGWIVSLDYHLSKTIAQKKFFEWCPESDIKHWYEKDKICEMKSGNIVEFKSADAGRKKFQSASLRWCAIDEECPQDIFDEITARQSANQDLDIWLGLTPLEGLTWVITELKELYDDYQLKLKRDEKVLVEA